MTRYDAAKRGLKINIVAPAGYGARQGCVGLDEMSISNPNIEFRYTTSAIDRQLGAFGLSAQR